MRETQKKPAFSGLSKDEKAACEWAASMGYAIPANSQRGIFMVGLLACFLVAPFVTLLPAAIAAGIAIFLIFKILRIEKNLNSLVATWVDAGRSKR